MVNICNLKQTPKVSNSLLLDPTENLFKNSAFVENFDGNLKDIDGGAGIVYSGKMPTNIIPYIHYKELDAQLDGMQAIATASHVIKMSDTEYTVIYPSFNKSAGAELENKPIGESAQIVFEDDKESMPALTNNNTNKTQISHGGKNYTLYFVDSSVDLGTDLITMAGGGLEGDVSVVSEVKQILKNIQANEPVLIDPVVKPNPGPGPGPVLGPGPCQRPVSLRSGPQSPTPP